MNQGVVQSSPVQQMVAAAGSPTWWSTIRPPPPPHHHSFPNIAAASDTHLDHQLQDSWSQLLLYVHLSLSLDPLSLLDACITCNLYIYMILNIYHDASPASYIYN